MKKIIMILASFTAMGAFAGSLSVKPGQLGEANLKAGETISVSLVGAKGCVDLGVYERAGTVATAEVVLTGGGYAKAGSARLTHLYGTMTTATITARQATGPIHVVYKLPSQATCLKVARTQKPA